MNITRKYRIIIFLLLITISSLLLPQTQTQTLSANSLAVSYGPYVYSAGYDSSDPQTSFFLQPGNAVSVKYLFSFSDKSFDIYAGLGYSQLYDTRVTSLEFVKGFSSIFIDAGLSYHFSDNFSLSGFTRMHNSQYNNTKTFFAHIEVGISPNITFVNDTESKALHQAAKITFPLTFDIRKDLMYAFSFGVGLEIELQLVRDSTAEIDTENVLSEDST